VLSAENSLLSASSLFQSIATEEPKRQSRVQDVGSGTGAIVDENLYQQRNNQEK